MKRGYLIQILVLIAAFFSLSANSHAENLLINPGFEKVDPVGWSTYGDSTYDTDTYRNDKQSGKAWVFDYGDGLFEQFVNVIPGTQYQASVYMLNKTADPIKDGAKAWIQIEWFTSDNAIIGDAVKSPLLDGPTDTWKLFSTPAAIAPSNAAKAKVKLVMEAPDKKKNTDGSCYFDDATFGVVPLK